MIRKTTLQRLSLALSTLFVTATVAIAESLPPLPIIALEQVPPESSTTTATTTSLDTITSTGTLYYAGIWRAVVSLAIVIGLIYLTAWLYKKLNNFNSQNIAKSPKNLDTNKFKLLSTQALGANKNLHVVEINGKYLVIGSTANNISLIKEFDKTIIDGSTTEEEKLPIEETFSATKLVDPDESIPIDKQLKQILDKYNDFT